MALSSGQDCGVALWHCACDVKAQACNTVSDWGGVSVCSE